MTTITSSERVPPTARTVPPEEPENTGHVHILWTEPQYEVWRRPDGERWCFICRKRRDFEHVRTAAIEMSYYGPIDQIECSTCHTIDGDCFPGSGRQWL